MAESAAELLAAMCSDLRLLRSQAGGPSLRDLERRLRLGKSQLGAILAGRVRRPPDWQVVAGLVRAFHAHAATHGRLDRLSLRTGVEEYWRPRYGLIEHAFQAAERVPAEAPPAAGRPALLPPAVSGFTGRRREIAALDRILDHVGDSPAVVISAVSGMAGVGKTALAAHWAHTVARRFPDGQLYVNLHGFGPGGQVLDPGEALRGFLDMLGVAADRIPVGVDERAALFRSRLSGRRVLVVLDNARDVEQVRPLLPGAAGCLALVTSRDSLGGLVATDGAYPLTLDVMTVGDARDLLARRLGADRMAAEPDAVTEIVGRCGRLPLALAVVAARAAGRPDFPLAVHADELRATADGLDALDGGDRYTNLRGVFSWSYRAVSPDAARLFRRLSLHPGPDVSVPAVASLDGVPVRAARARLAELTRAHLLTEHSPGRFGLHDLLRAYAAELADAHETAAERGAAVHRLLDHLLATALVATVRLNPMREPIAIDPPQPGVAEQPLASRDEALAWFDAEQATLRRAVALAASAGFDAHAWKLAWAGRVYFARRGRWREYEEIESVALRAARRIGDLSGEADALRSIGLAHVRMHRPEDAAVHFRVALLRYTELGDANGAALTHLSMYGIAASPTAALAHANEAADLYRSVGNRAGEAVALNGIGWSRAMDGDFAGALDPCQRALAIQEELGDRDGQAATLDSLGLAHSNLGNHHRAYACFDRGLELCRSLGYPYLEAGSLGRLGDAYERAGEIDAARRSWVRALGILESLDHPDADGVRAKIRATDP